MDVDETHIAGRWWRQIPAGADVHNEPPDPPSLRWQRGEEIEGLYFADSDATAWAEWYRYLAEAGVPPMHALPRDLWRWEISLPRVADLSDVDRLARVGLAAPTPGRAQWPQFQDVGVSLWKDGWPALVAPSAARPEGRVLCVFRETRIVPGTEPLPPPQTFDEPPLVPRGMTT